MAQIPLNKFVRKFKLLSDFKTDSSPLYICPSQRATIVLTIQAANITNKTATVTVGVSSIDDRTLYYLVSGYTIPRNDSVDLALGKILLIAGDTIIAYTDVDTSSGVQTSFALLEAFNES
jgi:hypothetical protein